MSLSEREDGPSRTLTLQDSYRSALEKRFRNLRRVLRETIVKNDALSIARTNEEPEEPGDVPELEVEEGFEFSSDPAKQIAFYNLLQQWIDEGILEPITDDAIEQGRHYTSWYAYGAYKSGVRYADGLLRRAGQELDDDDVEVILDRPIHVNQLRTIYMRNYENLRDITKEMDREISNIFARGMREGWNARRMAGTINREVEDIQHNRARTLARTETMHTHNSSSLKRYQEFDVVEVEVLTHTPCPICQRIEANNPYEISEAFGLVPAHPNCVCTYAPVV